MLPERVWAHPEVKADVGRVAIRRGPMVYCLEGQDQAAALHRLRLPSDADLSAAFRDSLLGGIVVVQATGHAVAEPSSDLYRTAPPAEAASPLLAVPYYIWCNRGQNPMQVWIRE